jgi:hypothetical protein
MNPNVPDGQEAAVIQALMVRATYGQAQMSERQIARATGLSRSCVQRTLSRLVKSRQVSIKEQAGHLDPTLWEIAGQGVARGVAHEPETARENAIPTMPFQLLSPTGIDSSWFTCAFHALSRAYSDMASGRISVACRKCADTGYWVDRVSVEYTRAWLKVCTCEVGEGKSIPDLGEYVTEPIIAFCQMCGDTGWVTVHNGQVQRCYSCRKSWGKYT